MSDSPIPTGSRFVSPHLLNKESFPAPQRSTTFIGSRYNATRTPLSRNVGHESVHNGNVRTPNWRPGRPQVDPPDEGDSIPTDDGGASLSSASDPEDTFRDYPVAPSSTLHRSLRPGTLIKHQEKKIANSQRHGLTNGDNISTLRRTKSESNPPVNGLFPRERTHQLLQRAKSESTGGAARSYFLREDTGLGPKIVTRQGTFIAGSGRRLFSDSGSMLDKSYHNHFAFHSGSKGRGTVPRGLSHKFPASSFPPPGPLSQHSSGAQTAREYPGRHPGRSQTPRDQPSPFLQRSKSEDCLKCMLKVPHKKCEGHKYIRVGGGYRHSYWHVKALLEEIELQRQRELLRQQRLEAIQENHGLRAIKTYIRTKSGRLIEKIVWLTEEDYQAFLAGGKTAEDILKKYLSKDEAAGLESWDEEEQKAITTWIRTKSGRLIQKTVYISKADFEKMKRGELDAESVLKKYLGEGEKFEGWEECEMKAIKTWIRTKSGRLIEKLVMVSKEDYEKMLELKRQGKDPNSILNKYLTLEEGQTIEGWEKKESAPMKVVKTMIRTKSGRLIEKTILMTEEEYKQFLASGGDPNFLRKFLDIGKDDVIESWEKASTVYSAGSDAEAIAKAKVGSRIIGKDGKVYEIVIDPITGKKYKKLIGGPEASKKKKGITPGVGNEDPNEKGMTAEEIMAYRAGKRRDGSDSEFSYKSFMSEGGTRHVRRRRRRADGTYSDSESYHSDQDEAGKLRRQKRRAARKGEAIKKKQERYKQGKRNDDSDSDYSYKSFVSAGGTRHVRRRRKRGDGTYSASVSYHSSQDEAGAKRRKARRAGREKAFKQGKRNPDSDSEYSYKSYVSAGGTRHVRRRRKRGDGTYSASVSYHSSQDEDGKARRRKRREKRQKGLKMGKRNADSDSDYSYKSFVSAGGTRHVRRRRKRGDGTYSDSASYHSSQDEDGMARRRRRRRDRKHQGSANSYYSVVSEGGTRHVRRRRRREDGTYSDSESYHSGDTDMFDKESDVFSGSLLSTDSADEPDLSKMTEAERKAYLSAKAKRKAERERRRREKYGDKYDEMMEKHKKQKDAKKKAKSMVTYDKGGARFKDAPSDDRQPGLGWEEYTDEHGRKVRRRKGSDGKIIEEYYDKDGNLVTRVTDKDGKVTEEYVDKDGKKVKKVKDGDEEWEEYTDEHGNTVRRVRRGSKIIEEYVDKDGNIVRKIKNADGEEWEEIIGKDGKVTRRKIKSADEESLYEYERDADGNVLYDADGNPIKRRIGRFKKGQGKEGFEDENYVYKYDKDGNLMRIKKGDKEPEEPDNGDYFEVGPDGKLRLKAGKRKIDISKLTEEELRALGIDLKTMTKEEIARILKEKFGEDIEIVKGGKKIGLKHIDDYGSDANTDDLANDSDLDISTLRGPQRMRVLMKRGGEVLLEHLKKIIAESKLTDEAHVHQEEKDRSIDFLKHYKLVDANRVDKYARAFVVEDDDYDGVIYPREARLALESVPTVKEITEKQVDLVLKLLDFDRETNVTFRMFAVMTALAERVTSMDKHCKKLIEISELSDIERKMELYRSMFYCNVPSDMDPNYIQVDSLRIDLIAGGLNWKQQEFIMSKFSPTEWDEISFLDYLAYIPLFMSMHDNMCNNPLDMSNNKYTERQPSAAQRDQNPLGHHLKKESPFISRTNNRQQLHSTAKDLLSGKEATVKQENVEMFNKYQKLPHIASHSHPATARKQ